MTVHPTSAPEQLGRLRVEPGIAAQAIMSANVGVALSLVTQPEVYAEPDLSVRVRDAVHARLLVVDRIESPVSDVSLTALQLSAQLRTSPSRTMTPTEFALLHGWLDRLAGPAAN